MEMQCAFTIHENSPLWVERSKKWISACHLKVTGDQYGAGNYDLISSVCRLISAFGHRLK